MQVLINSTGIGNGLQLSRLLLIEPPLQAFITKKALPLTHSPPAKVSKTPSSLQPVAPWVGNIFANFHKNWNGVTGIIRNPRKDDPWNNLKSTIWWHCLFNDLLCPYSCVMCAWCGYQTHGSGSCGSGFTTLPAMRYCYRQRIPVYLRHNGVPTTSMSGGCGGGLAACNPMQLPADPSMAAAVLSSAYSDLGKCIR